MTEDLFTFLERNWSTAEHMRLYQEIETLAYQVGNPISPEHIPFPHS
jgi:hypothetical protein